MCIRDSMVNLTLHHNRFSCAVPESLGNNEVSGLVIMGNMLGNGSLLNAPWISREEQQLFLYYSPQVWKSTILVLTGFLLLMTSAALCRRKLQTKLEETSLGLTNDIEARVVASNLALWLGLLCACFLCEREWRALYPHDPPKRTHTVSFCFSSAINQG